MRNELQNYLERPKRYNNIDGTGEMAMGLMGLGFTFLNYLSAVLPKNSMWRHGFPSMVLFVGGLLLMFGVLHWGPKAIKKHITWPRTGYVASPRWRKVLVDNDDRSRRSWGRACLPDMLRQAARLEEPYVDGQRSHLRGGVWVLDLPL